MRTFAPVGTVGEIGGPHVEAFVLLLGRAASVVVVRSLWCHGAGCGVLVCRKHDGCVPHGLAETESFWRWSRLSAWRQRRRAGGGGPGPLLSPKRDSIASCFPTRK